MSVVLIMPHTEQMMKSTFQGCWTTLGKALAILKSYVSRMPNSTSRFVASRTTSTPPAAPPTSSSRRTTSRTRPSEKWQGAIFNHILGKARSSCGCLSWIKPMTPFFKLLKPYSSSGYISLKGLTIFICHGFNEQMQQKEDSTEYTKMGDFKIKLWALAFKPAAFCSMSLCLGFSSHKSTTLPQLGATTLGGTSGLPLNNSHGHQQFCWCATVSLTAISLQDHLCFQILFCGSRQRCVLYDLLAKSC